MPPNHVHMPDPKHSVAVCILTFNSERWIESCLASVLRSDAPLAWTLVIDNASTDGTCRLVQDRFPTVELMRNRQNLGCAEGNNVGLRTALARDVDHLLILNPDTTVESDCIRELLAAAGTDPRWGILSPIQLNYEGTGLEGYLEELLAKHGYRYPPEGARPANETWPVQTVVGAAMLVRMKMVREAGGFDPFYFTYGEETDLCRERRVHPRDLQEQERGVHDKKHDDARARQADAASLEAVRPVGGQDRPPNANEEIELSG